MIAVDWKLGMLCLLEQQQQDLYLLWVYISSLTRPLVDHSAILNNRRIIKLLGSTCLVLRKESHDVSRIEADIKLSIMEKAGIRPPDENLLVSLNQILKKMNQ